MAHMHSQHAPALRFTLDFDFNDSKFRQSLFCAGPTVGRLCSKPLHNLPQAILHGSDDRHLAADMADLLLTCTTEEQRIVSPCTLAIEHQHGLASMRMC